jgi:curli biogenesis system outer membrane secretion channel CsgG
MWIAAVSVVAILLLALPSQAGVLDKLKKRGKKKSMLQEQIRSCIEKRAWIAYFRDEEGELAPVRDTLNTDDDDEWIGLRFTQYEGPRIRLGVLQVINKAAEAEENGWSGRIEVPVSGIQEMLTQALYATRRFDVIEQKRAKDIVAQQKREDVVEPSPSVIANKGKVLGVQYLVYGTVNEWTPERSSRKAGPGAFFMAGKKEAEVSITFNLADVGTGQILYTTMEQARMGEWSFDFSTANGGSGGAQQNTPVGYAVRACVNKAAFKIATFLRDRKWKGSVVDIKSNGIYINAGRQQGMATKTKLAVLTVRGKVKDRESGTLLGEDLVGSGTLEVVAVQDGFSIAQEAPGTKKAKIKIGDRVELASEPVLPPKIPECVNLDTSQAL